MQEYLLKASPQDSGKRLDAFIVDFAKIRKLGLSRESIKKLILEKNISLKDASLLLKPNYKIKFGDEISLRIPDKETAVAEAENIPLDVIFEDEDLAVLNKPCGLVVHPAPGNPEHTLVNAILHRFKKLSDINPQRPGIVHRLDKDTSGLLVIAKNNYTHLDLAEQFAKHTIKRKYIALVSGKTEFDEGVIELPIGRHPYKRKSMAVSFSRDTKYAKTFYRTLERKKDSSLLELEPFTGRTHQLRVHLAHLGHPILGDTKYAKSNKFKRMALHALYLGFVHPRTKKFVEFSCSLPAEFKEFM